MYDPHFLDRAAENQGGHVKMLSSPYCIYDLRFMLMEDVRGVHLLCAAPLKLLRPLKSVWYASCRTRRQQQPLAASRTTHSQSAWWPSPAEAASRQLHHKTTQPLRIRLPQHCQLQQTQRQLLTMRQSSPCWEQRQVGRGSQARACRVQEQGLCLLKPLHLRPLRMPMQ